MIHNLKLFWKFMILALMITIIAGIAVTKTLKEEYENLYKFLLFPYLEFDKGNLHLERLRYNLREFTLPDLSPDKRAVLVKAIIKEDQLMNDFIAQYESKWQNFINHAATSERQHLQIFEAKAIAQFHNIYKAYVSKRDALLSGENISFTDINTYLNQISTTFDLLLKVTRQFANYSNESAQNAIAEMHWMLIGYGILFSLFALAVIWWLTHIVTNPMVQLSRATKQLLQGNLNFDNEKIINRKDEIGDIGRAIDSLSRYFKQDWLKTGQVQLNKLMSGEQKVTRLAKAIISFLIPYVEAQAGVFYQVKKSNYLQVIASYGYTANIPQQFEMGDGLVGQAAMEKKMIFHTHTPEEYTQIIQSCMAMTVPRYVLLIPFLYENTVKGVIEICFSSQAPTTLQKDFLCLVMPSIGVAMNTAQSCSKRQILLEESKKHSKKLQRQSEKLQLSNKALTERTVELERREEEIRQKNVALEQSQASITNVKNAIEAKAKALTLVSQYKSDFLANMSHELRTPLNAMLMVSQLLADNLQGHLSKTEVEQAHTIHQAGLELLKLINEILDLSKIEAGKIEIHIENLSLANFVKRVKQKFNPFAEKKGLAFHITIADNVPSVLQTDKLRFQQIINNLLSNAFKFTNTGEIRMEIQCVYEPIQKLVISVADTGVGIPIEKQKLIFEAFQQADENTEQHYGGTGLGLSISNQLAKLLEGYLELHSEEGQGSTFTFYLPIRPQETLLKTSETQTISKVIEDNRNNLTHDDKIILIIEDDPAFAQVLNELAQEKHFKTIVAEDGEIGLQLAEQYIPNIILLDIGLPQMDGWKVMERLKENSKTRHIPVQFISAQGDSLNAKKMGAIGYLQKPVTPKRIKNTFEEIEQFLSKTVKTVLFLVDNKEAKQQIVDLIGDDDVQTTQAFTRMEALKHLQKAEFDCIIIDVNVEQSSGLKLLEPLYNDDRLSQIPVIVYMDRELTASEDVLLQQSMDTLTLKTVRSPEHLLDETTLFLHQEKAKLSQEKQEILQNLHDHNNLLKGKKILIVDDDRRNSFVLATILENKDMEVVAAYHGQEALSILDELPDIDLVLMDIMMPVMDGYKAMQKIREQSRFHQLPIIAITAKAMKEDKAKCLEAGANDYLSKPVDTDKLLSLMRVWLYQ